ncbi:MAG: hypothetical protein Q9O74_05305 [Planctomycetota bacterium]|nr:hypothetical protein [Planctomycetota bacterium]
MRIPRLPTIVALCTATTATTLAQCDPAWNTTPGNPGVGDGYADPATEWDDGNGQALYIGGSFQRIGGINNLRGIAKYDPATNTYAKLGSGISYGNTNGFMTSIQPFNANGEALLVAGGVADTQSLAAWDGTQWRSLGAGFAPPQAVWGMTVGDLVVCGNFTRTGDEQTSNGIAFINACPNDCRADFNQDGIVDTRDVTAFFNLWSAGC